MATGGIIWLVVYAAASLLFFAVAGIIAVLGFQDLRLLLSRSDKKSEKER